MDEVAETYVLHTSFTINYNIYTRSGSKCIGEKYSWGSVSGFVFFYLLTLFFFFWGGGLVFFFFFVKRGKSMIFNEGFMIYKVPNLSPFPCKLQFTYTCSFLLCFRLFVDSSVNDFRIHWMIRYIFI